MASFSVYGCEKETQSSEIDIAQLPEKWPLPFNDGITITSSDTRIKGQCGFRIWENTGIYAGPAEEIYSWYKTNLKDWNMDEDSETTTTDNLKLYSFRVSTDDYGAQFKFTHIREEKADVYIFVEER